MECENTLKKTRIILKNIKKYKEIMLLVTTLPELIYSTCILFGVKYISLLNLAKYVFFDIFIINNNNIKCF
jgi:hypothetical protein